jgi:hypothetical protein
MAQDIVAKIQAAAQASGVDPDVALRIAGVESSFRPAAKNTESTAAGLFQVTGPTWKQYGGKPGKQRDVDENIRVGMKILSSNKASMQEFLGREPLPSDIYAAHFFGPTGARAVMSADPLTPVASVVSKQVMEANPQLAGKTVNEVLTGYRQKFDKGGKRYPTSEPVKTTTVGQGTRTMDQEAGAAAPALSARDRVAGMGSNYQAALAAMMLGEASDEDDKDDDTDTPKEEAYKAPAAANALSELDLGSTVSPFDAMEPAVQPEGAKYPMRFAEGGLALPVGEAFTIKTAKDLQVKPYYDLEEMAKQDDSIWSKLPSEVFGIPISQDTYKQAALSGLGYAVGLGPLMNKVNQATGLVKTGLNVYDIATGQYLPNNPEVYQINNANIPARKSGMPAPVISSMSQPPAPVVNLSTPYVPASGSEHWGGTPAPAPAPVSSSTDYGSVNDFGGSDSSVGSSTDSGFDAGYGGFGMGFAGGGFVPKAAYSPTEKRELEDFNNQWQGYQDQYDTWRKEQYDPYQAAYEKYQTEVYNPYQTAYKAYESDYAKYAKAMDAYNAALPTRPMSTTEAMSYRPPVSPDEPVAPTLAREFTMEAPTTNLRPPGLTQEAYAGMDQAALDKYAQEQSAAASARATQASADQRNRQSALNVAFNPEQFNLSLPDRIASRFMADGGEVEEYPGIMDVRDYATQASERMFPTEAGEDDRRDAARHMLAAALASKAVGPTAADLLGKAHERFSNAESFFNMFGVGEPRYDYDMDVQNNRIGISLADQATSRDELEALVKQMAEQASIRRNPNLPWTMDQEQRDALIEDRKRRLETPQYKNDGGEMVADETFSKDFEGYKALDPRAVEEAIYRSRNLTKKTDPDSWPSPGNPRRSIPNEPRDYPTRAGQELLEFLKQADRMPTVVEPRRYPGGSYDAPGFTYRSNNPEDRGVVEVPTFTKDGYGTLVHELTHATDRTMEVEQLRLYRKVRAGEPLTPEEQRFYDGYSKLYGHGDAAAAGPFRILI